MNTAQLVQQAAATAGAVALLAALGWRLVRPHVRRFVHEVADELAADVARRLERLEERLERLGLIDRRGGDYFVSRDDAQIALLRHEVEQLQRRREKDR